MRFLVPADQPESINLGGTRCGEFGRCVIVGHESGLVGGKGLRSDGGWPCPTLGRFVLAGGLWLAAAGCRLARILRGLVPGRCLDGSHRLGPAMPVHGGAHA